MTKWYGRLMRRMLTDQQWAKIEPLLPAQRSGQRGRPYNTDHRTTIEAILWIARTGAPWRDLPPEYGKWSTVYRRFNRWAKTGIFEQVFESLGTELDLGVMMVDGTFVKVHQHGSGPPKEQAPRRSDEPAGGSTPCSSWQPTDTGGTPASN